MHGCNGRILRVDLSVEKSYVEEPSAKIYRKYLGGGALASYYLLKELKPGVDPLSPENMLVIMTSVITGTPLSGLNRFTVAAKSPLTDCYGESEAGGWWAPELKLAGFDGIIVKGTSPEPAYLWIHDQQVELRKASHLWGKTSGEVQDIIRMELADNRVRVLQTGIAGENRVRFSSIVNELKHFNGRTGLGAVMGSKNLRAIAVRSTKKKKLAIAHREDAKNIARWFLEHCDRGPGSLHELGTSRGIMGLQRDGILPTRNFRQGSFEHASDISGEQMRDTILVKRGTCHGCIVACKREVKIAEHGVEPRYGGPEYETMAAFGSLCGIGDLKVIARANQMAGEYVLDTISTGAVIAFAMECYENGLLSYEDTGGVELTFGNGKALLQTIDMIAHREGFGDTLAEGVMRASAKIGKGSSKYAMHVKGQELPLHEPRGKKGLALSYATSPTGADHIEAMHDPFFESFDADASNPFAGLGLLDPVDRLDLGIRKVRAFYYAQLVWSLYNSIGLCNFVGTPHGALSLTKLVEYVNAVTGWDTSLWELLKVGERSNTMLRAFNYREGTTQLDDTLPERFFEGLENGPLKDSKIEKAEFRDALRIYYQMAGWDPSSGSPTDTKLGELDLLWTKK